MPTPRKAGHGIHIPQSPSPAAEPLPQTILISPVRSLSLASGGLHPHVCVRFGRLNVLNGSRQGFEESNQIRFFLRGKIQFENKLRLAWRAIAAAIVEFHHI